MNYKKLIAILFLLVGFAVAQEEKMVSLPESQLTEQQKAALVRQNSSISLQNAHGWVGLGKEIGEAVNTSLAAITTQADNFSKTGVGKLTVLLVVWKVLGDQAIHFISAVIELLIFVPIFLWSYRKSCMDKTICVSRDWSWGHLKSEHQVIPYDKKCDFTPRHGHALALCVFTVIWLLTLFAYS